MSTIQMVSAPYALKAVSLKQLLVWEYWAEQTFQGQAQLEAQAPHPLVGLLQQGWGLLLLEIYKVFHSMNFLDMVF